MHLRFFADTGPTGTGPIALQYLRALIRIAPVRLVTVTGDLAPSWRMFDQLLATPIDTPMIASVVCTDPTQWCQRIKIPMPENDPLRQVLATGDAAADMGTEVASTLRELYTAGTRNVLIATSAPRTEDQRRTAERYEAVIVNKPELVRQFTTSDGGRICMPFAIPTPVVDHLAMRAAVLPPRR